MSKEPKKIKLTDAPSSKDVKRIPMPSLDHNYIKPDSDCIYKPIENENTEQNNS